jgi:hypothetical protein
MVSNMVSVRFLQFDAEEVPPMFPLHLRRLHNALAGNKTLDARSGGDLGVSLGVRDGEAAAAGKKAKTWGEKFRALRSWWYHNLFAEPLVAATEVVLGRCPDKVSKKLLDRDENHKVASRLWAATHGLSHLVMGVIPPRFVPGALLRFHTRSKLRAYNMLDPAQQLQKDFARLIQAARNRQRFGTLNDVEVAAEMEGNLQPLFEQGSPPWEVVEQGIRRLRRANDGPTIDETGEDTTAPARGEQAAEQEAPAVVTADATPTHDVEDFVPTPTDAEFKALMQRVSTEGTSPTDKPATPGTNEGGKDVAGEGTDRGGPGGEHGTLP